SVEYATNDGGRLIEYEYETGDVLALAFAPDGRWFASLSFDHTVRLWTASGEGVAGPGGRHSGPVLGCAFSADGTRLVTGSMNPPVRSLLHHFRDLGFGPRHDVRVSLGSNPVARAPERTLAVWEASSGRPVAWLETNDDVKACAFSPDGTLLLTAGKAPDGFGGISFGSGFGRYQRLEPGRLDLWDARTFARIASIERHNLLPMSCGFAPDGRTFAVDEHAEGGRDTGVAVRETATGMRLSRWTAGNYLARGCHHSPDGGRVMAVVKGAVMVWDVATDAEKFTCQHSGASVAAFSPDGAELASVSTDGTLSLWDAHTGGELARWAAHDGGAKLISCAYSPDGTRIVTGSHDRKVRVWDRASRALVGEFWADSEVNVVAWGPDPRVFAAGDFAGHVTCFTLESFSPVVPVVTARRSEGEPDCAFRCPLCGAVTRLPLAGLGRETDCPACAGRLILNAFTVAGRWDPGPPPRELLVKAGVSVIPDRQDPSTRWLLLAPDPPATPTTPVPPASPGAIARFPSPGATTPPTGGKSLTGVPAPLLTPPPVGAVKPPDDSLLDRAHALLATGRAEDALSLMHGCQKRTPAEENALGVCLLRCNRFDEAIVLFRGLALANDRPRPGASAVVAVNLATAYLLDANLPQCEWVLDTFGAGRLSGRDRRLRAAIRRWREGRGWAARLLEIVRIGGETVSIDFPPGELLD
ncbi:MAG TPA: hypothetical protein VH092_23685, partial [Urbifossiella sp.]|nr:hypothetical protein [Urbifossiella sp.]